MLHIALYEPEIPPNTGNIIRLCANTGAQLHLIKPLGFEIDDKRLRRAGLDYHAAASIQIHDDFDAFKKAINIQRLFACSTKGTQCYANVEYKNGDVFLFGPETRGLPKELLQKFNSDCILKIPMVTNQRSLNLSNSVAIILYEAWRQLEFSW